MRALPSFLPNDILALLFGDRVTRNNPRGVVGRVPLKGDKSMDKGGRDRTGWIERDDEEETTRDREAESESESEMAEGAREEKERARETGGARSIPTANPVVTHKLPYIHNVSPCPSPCSL